MSKTLQQEVDELNKELEKGKLDPPVQGQTLVVTNISKDIEQLFTDKSKAAFKSGKLTQLTTKFDNGRVEVVRFFGVRTSLESVGALKIAEIFNEISSTYNIKGILSPPSQLELHNPNENAKSIASFFYVGLDSTEAVIAEKHEFSMYEGGAPKLTFETPEEIEKARSLGLDKLNK